MSKRMINMRKHETRRSSKHKFYKSSKPHPMNRVKSFVSGHGIFRGGVQV